LADNVEKMNIGCSVPMDNNSFNNPVFCSESHLALKWF